MRIRLRLCALALFGLGGLLGSLSASCASGGGSQGGTKAAPAQPAMGFAASSRTQADYGIARWQFFVGAETGTKNGEQVIVAGVDDHGKAIEGVSLTALILGSQNQVTLEMLDGTEDAIVFETERAEGMPGSLVGTISEAQATFLAHVLVDLQTRLTSSGTAPSALHPRASTGLAASDLQGDCVSGDLPATVVFGLYSCSPPSDVTDVVLGAVSTLVGTVVHGPATASCGDGLNALLESVMCPGPYNSGPTSCPAGQSIVSDSYGNTSCSQGPLTIGCRPTPSQPCTGAGAGGGSGGGAGSGQVSGQVNDCPGGPGCPGGPPPAYGFVTRRTPGRHQSYALSDGESAVVPLIWKARPGIAPADLSIAVGGRDVLQIAEAGERPFARAGLELVMLDAETHYEAILSRRGDRVEVKLVRRASRLAGEEATLLDVVYAAPTFWSSATR